MAAPQDPAQRVPGAPPPPMRPPMWGPPVLPPPNGHPLVEFDPTLQYGPRFNGYFSEGLTNNPDLNLMFRDANLFTGQVETEAAFKAGYPPPGYPQPVGYNPNGNPASMYPQFQPIKPPTFTSGTPGDGTAPAANGSGGQSASPTEATTGAAHGTTPATTPATDGSGGQGTTTPAGGSSGE
jgi:hypothetical protein